MHIPLAELPYRFNEINTSKDIVVYCQTGTRSNTAIALLKQLNFQNRLLKLEGILEDYE